MRYTKERLVQKLVKIEYFQIINNRTTHFCKTIYNTI